MSVAGAQKFIDEVEQNADLQAQIQADKSDLVSMGKALGCEFTEAELVAELKSRWGGKKPEDTPFTTTMI